MPKLSIITVNLNDAAGLQRTIESVINQTYTDIEYIIIDGGSTDDSIEIIKEYADKITYWVSEPDKGIYHAMNKGILQAKGEYCQFINSGDYLVSDDITERMLTDMPDCNILYCDMRKELNGERVKVIPEKNITKITLLDLFIGTINHSSTYIKRSLFEKYGLYDESLKIVADWKFFLVTVGLNDESIVLRKDVVTVFDISGISNTHRQLDLEERRKVLKDLLPQTILLDYEKFAKDTRLIKRLKRNNIIWFIIKICYRLLLKYDLIFHYKK